MYEKPKADFKKDEQLIQCQICQKPISNPPEGQLQICLNCKKDLFSKEN